MATEASWLDLLGAALGGGATVKGVDIAYQVLRHRSDRKRTAKELGEALRAFMGGDERALKGMSIGSDPGGGYMVLPAFSGSMTRVEVDFSPMRQIARVVPIEQADALSRTAQFSPVV